MSEMVKVKIYASERVSYYQIVEMPKEDFDRIDAMFESDCDDDEIAEAVFDRWVDRTDVFDDEDQEVFSFQLDDGDIHD